MAKCKTCHSSSFRKETVHRYQDDLMGIPLVLIDAVEQEVCAACGEVRGILIRNLEGLVAAVAVARATKPHKLNGAEIKFMRKALGWKAKDLAEKLEVKPETLSRWESGPQPINNQAERYLRLVVGNLLTDKAPRIPFEPEEVVNMRIIPIRPARLPPMTLRLVREDQAGTTEAYQPLAEAA